MVADQSAALSALGIEHLVLSSGPAPEGLPHALVPQLDYLEDADHPPNLHPLLLAACQAHFGSPPDLWHLHNPTLGKSILFPRLVQDLAESQIPLVLQIHDFAEDNRPSNYPRLVGEKIYPVAPQIHYAFINRRDQAFLKQAGLPEKSGHLLANAIVAPLGPVPPSPPPPPQKKVLYPVRGIRRKNLGEIVLLAALAPADTEFFVSLAPDNAQWLDVHDRWKAFAHQENLAVNFDVTDRLAPAADAEKDFRSWLTHSTHLITTSIAEGFGLTYLEPALCRRPLLGRDLSEITSDFASQGIQAGRLYPKIAIPLTALDEEELRHQLRERLLDNSQQYGVPFEERMVAEAWKNLTQGGEIDFGNLPEPFQESVILNHLNGRTNDLQPVQEWLEKVLQETQPTVTAEQLEPYSLTRSQENLTHLYQQAITASPSAPRWLSKERVLAQYLSPERFHFLRS